MERTAPYFRQKKPKVLVIGGGAAGFFGAIRVAELLPEGQVDILEAGKEVLSKVRISGGGRCNVTHACFEPRPLSKFYPRGERELLGPFNQFAPGDTMAWYDDHGVELKIEEDGRVFPVSNSSSSIVNCLLGRADALGVNVHLRHRIQQIYPPEQANQRWKVITANGDAFFGDVILLATGSSKRVWELLDHLGHQIVPPVPSLFTFNIKDSRLEGLQGLSVPHAEVTIMDQGFKATGPLLITHWGLSGPAILKLSAWAARALHKINYKFDIKVKWDIAENLDSIRQQLLNQKEEFPKKQIAGRSLFGMPSRLWQSLLLHSGVSKQQRWADFSKKQLNQLSQQLDSQQFSRSMGRAPSKKNS